MTKIQVVPTGTGGEIAAHNGEPRVESTLEIDALFENEIFLQWLDERLHVADRETGASFEAGEMRHFLDRTFAQARSKHGS